METHRAQLPPESPVPVPLTSFVGRDAETAHIGDLLRNGVRLLTLTGPGGIGKTRLALAASAALGDAFVDGVRFIPLAAVAAPELVGGEIARSLGVGRSGGSALLDRIRSDARGLEVLLLVDNFEHLLPAAPLLKHILEAGPGLRFLVTSRERLRLSGEWEFLVPPLPFPAPEALPSQREIAAYPAVRLFVNRARNADQEFVLTESNAAAVAAVCQRLDGVPLAIELAAARSRHLPPAALLTRLARRLPLLTGGPRDAPARLRTMRDAVAWSYDLLDHDEQALFRRLAVFAGGFTLDAAEAVALRRETEDGKGRDDVSAAFRFPTPVPVLDGIASLVDKSLLHRLPPTDNETASRFAMLETVREYAIERLATAGEDQETRARHAAYLLELARACAGPGPSRTEALDALELEREDLRAALSWWRDTGDWQSLLTLAVLLGDFWQRRGHLLEGKGWLEEALARAPAASPALHAAALNALGDTLRGLGEHRKAKERFEAAIGIARANGDRRGEATALNGLAALADDAGDIAANRALCEAGIPLWRALGDHSGLARALQGLAWAKAGEKNMIAATDLMRQALARARTAGDEGFVAHLVASLGNLLVEQRRFTEARPYLQDGLELARRHGDRDEIVEIACDLAFLALELGAADEARSQLASTLPLLRTGGRRRDAVIALELSALLADADGERDRALRLVAAAAGLRDAMGIPIDRDPRIVVPGPTPARTQLRRLALDARGYPAVWTFSDALDAAEATASIASLRHASTERFGLTPRELDVLRLLAVGRSDRDIAGALFITRRTASKHVSAILAKLGAVSRTEAATSALREGIV